LTQVQPEQHTFVGAAGVLQGAHAAEHASEQAASNISEQSRRATEQTMIVGFGLDALPSLTPSLSHASCGYMEID
jgi:hypothetical protein